VDFLFYKTYLFLSKLKRNDSTAGSAKFATSLLLSITLCSYTIFILGLLLLIQKKGFYEIFLTYIVFVLFIFTYSLLRYNNNKTFSKIIKKCKNLPAYNTSKSNIFFWSIFLGGYLINLSFIFLV
jgi:hypothetical protein